MEVPPFTYSGLPYRVLHGAGCAGKLGDELDRIGARRAMFCCTSRRRAAVETLAREAGDRIAGICDKAMIFVPWDAVEKGRKAATDLEADCLISFGGGSSVGLAKAIALELDIPIVGIATTYSGSETTALQGIVGRDGVRTNYRSMRMLPKCLIYDPELTVDLPLDVSIPSGFNAMSHAVSSFLGERANPVAELFAEAGIAAMSSALDGVSEDPANVEARGRALYGSWLCGLTVMSAGTTIHHKIVHVLGTGHGLPHGPTHAVVLPHSTAYNRDSAPEAMRRIARALGASDAPDALFRLLERSGAATGLKDLGLPYRALDEAADKAMIDRYFNRRTYERGAIRDLLEDAWRGRPPAA